MSIPRIIAFYLPQYYPTKENNIWYHKGFTEWTNVGKAKPLFKNHYQPKVPADLGYYDLRLPEVREQQAILAKEAGIEGFCYWHYWFNGRRLLDRVFNEVIESQSPDFPFCLCWANHSWYKKLWDLTKSDKLLIEQTYPGIDDYINHFNAMLPAFKDKRYMKINGKLIFGIYAPLHIPNIEEFFSTWNNLAKQHGLEGFYFFCFTYHSKDIEKLKTLGFDGIVHDFMSEAYSKCYSSLFNKIMRRIKIKLNKPLLMDYNRYIKYVSEKIDRQTYVHPCIIPNFDHSPRSKTKYIIINNSRPALWRKLLDNIFKNLSNRESQENLLFIKAWNEWGEGNYLEPDLKFGNQYLDELKNAKSSIDKP